jgi:hypothetical protein
VKGRIVQVTRTLVLLANLIVLLAVSAPAHAAPGPSPAASPAAQLSAAPEAKSTPGSGSQAAATLSGEHLDGVAAQTPGEREYDETEDDSVLDPHNWAVMAYKSRHEIVVYYKSRLYKIYHAVFGRSPEAGTKLWEGDRRTPEGLYVIVKKYPSKRFRCFLRLNYPNKVDRIRYQELRDEGSVPIDGGRPVPEGTAIGIHGTDEPVLNRGNIDWTTGCISIDNDAIEELDRLLPVGTIVVIKP